MKRGEVYLGVLEPRSGSEQRGRRPVIVLTHDSLNAILSWRSIIVVPISTTARESPTIVRLAKGTAGLRHDSAALCHQVTTVDRRKLIRHLGELSPFELRAVEDGVMNAMDLPAGAPPSPLSP